MDNINAGDLRHRIGVTLQSGPPQADPWGHPVEGVTSGGTFWALVEQAAADNPLNADQLRGIRKYRITARAAAFKVNPSDQITWKGQILNVVGVVVDPFGIMQVIDATGKITPSP